MDWNMLSLDVIGDHGVVTSPDEPYAVIRITRPDPATVVLTILDSYTDYGEAHEDALFRAMLTGDPEPESEPEPDNTIVIEQGGGG